MPIMIEAGCGTVLSLFESITCEAPPQHPKNRPAIYENPAVPFLFLLTALYRGMRGYYHAFGYLLQQFYNILVVKYEPGMVEAGRINCEIWMSKR